MKTKIKIKINGLHLSPLLGTYVPPFGCLCPPFGCLCPPICVPMSGPFWVGGHKPSRPPPPLCPQGDIGGHGRR